MQVSSRQPVAARVEPPPVSSGQAMDRMLEIARSLAGAELLVERLPSVVRVGLRVTTLATSNRWLVITTSDPAAPIRSARFVIEFTDGDVFTSSPHSFRDVSELDPFVRVVLRTVSVGTA